MRYIVLSYFFPEEHRMTKSTILKMLNITVKNLLVSTSLLAAFLITRDTHAETSVSATQKLQQPAKGNVIITLSGNVIFETKAGGLVYSIYAFINSAAAADTGVREFPLEGVNFDYSTAMINKDSNTTLDQLALIFKAFPNIPVKLQARAEGKMPTTHKADSVKAALTSRGVKESQISVIQTAAKEDDASNWSVKAVVTKKTA